MVKEFKSLYLASSAYEHSAQTLLIILKSKLNAVQQEIMSIENHK